MTSTDDAQMLMIDDTEYDMNLEDSEEWENFLETRGFSKVGDLYYDQDGLPVKDIMEEYSFYCELQYDQMKGK